MNMTYEMNGFEINDPALLKFVAAGDDTEGALFPTLFGTQGKVCYLSMNDAIVFAQSVNQSHAMVGLTLVAKKREPGALSIILESLQGCPTFQTLDLQMSLSEDELMSCAELINSSSSLKTLYLSETPFKTRCAEAFFSALANSKSIRRLSLKSCNISEEHTPFIANFLSQNKNIQHVSLHDTKLTHTMLPNILKGIKNNSESTLESLDLGSNPIGRIGMAHLATYLSERVSPACSLNVLDIGNCGLAEAGPEIGALLAGNNSLKKLDITFNQLELKQLKPISEGLLKNNVIEEIELSGQPLYGQQRLVSDPTISDLPQTVQIVLQQFEHKLEQNRSNNHSSPDLTKASK